MQTNQKKAPSRGISEVHHNYKLIENEAEAKNICDYLFTKEYLSLDTETTSTDAIDAELVGLSFSVAEQEAFYVPISANREEAQKNSKYI